MKEIIVFDTETTGLTNADAAPLETQPKMIEFAGIKLNNSLEEVSRFEFICNPGIEINDTIKRITGLSTNDVADKPTFTQFLPDLVEFFLGAETIIAHNLGFDIDIVKFELMRIGKLTAFPWPPKQICTVEKTIHINGHRLNLQKLYNLATGQSKIEGAHRAMVDVVALVDCVRWMDKQGILR